MERGSMIVYSEAYEEARKEFRNCLWMGLIGMGVPFVLAFKYWRPIMQREKQKALKAAAAPQDAQP